MCALPNVSTLTSYIGPVVTIAGVLIGFGLSRIPAGRDRRRKAAGYLRGIDAEIAYAAEHAREYVERDPPIYGPAYRLLTRFGVEATTWLAGEGIIVEAEIKAMLVYVAGAEEFNRCLEEVQALITGTRDEYNKKNLVNAEALTAAVACNSVQVDRATLKAKNLYHGDPYPGTAIAAHAAIRAAAARAGLKLAD